MNKNETDKPQTSDPATEILENVERKQSRLNLLVNISAVVVCLLMAAFFALIIRNMTLVTYWVDDIKEGPYPISVAAGHIETDLVRLQTIINSVTTETPLESYGMHEQYELYFDETIDDIQSQIDAILESRIKRPEMIDSLTREFRLLQLRLNVFTVMCWHEDSNRATHEEVIHYASEFIQPIIDKMLAIDTEILETSTHWVNEMNSRVSSASYLTTLFSVIMLIVVVAMIVVYMLLLRSKTRLENELRDNLKSALQSAREANEAKSMFLSNMSHDIRTPMNAIVGLTAIADENIDDKLRVKQCLTRITTSSQHLLSLINDVLDMNKIESGKVTLAEETFRLTDLIAEIDMIVRSQPRSRLLDYRIELEGIRFDDLIGDTMRLKQILLNLTSNAIKYTNEGDDMVFVVCEKNPKGEGELPDPEKGGNLVSSATIVGAVGIAGTAPRSRAGWVDVRFVVADTGIGMKRKFVERIFEPFEREQNDFTIFTEGTGLGMAITKNLVELMGGRIVVESMLGMGTTVTIDIPFKIAPNSRAGHGLDKLSGGDGAAGESAAHEGAAAPSAQNVPPSIASFTREIGAEKPADKLPTTRKQGAIVSGRVLIVEDNEINMEIAQSLISARGAEVEGANNGIEAVAAMKKVPAGYYDLVFMDCQMPHMNGIDATKAIREYSEENGLPHVPIVAMTANAFDSDRVEMLDAGMDDFMAKPINIHQLEDTLRKYLTPVKAKVSDESDESETD